MRAKRVNITAAGLSALCAIAALLFMSATARAQVVNSSVGTAEISPITTQVEIGPTLDVVPVVLADGYTINLTLIPSLLEFDGYDTPPVVPGVSGVVQVPTALPKFTVREVVTTVNVWDNQTVILGGLISSSVQSHQGQGAVPRRSAPGGAAVPKPVQDHDKEEPDDFCDGDDY